MSAWTRLKFVLAGISKITFEGPYLVLSFYNKLLKSWVQERMLISIIQDDKVLIPPTEFSDFSAESTKNGKGIKLLLPELPKGKYNIIFIPDREENDCISLPITT
jgi:hypothetical protein